MSVEFNRPEVMEFFKKKRQRAFVKTAHMGVSIAALNIGKLDGKRHIDTGASSVSKTFNSDKNSRIDVNDDSFTLDAPLFYDAYLEKRYGIMKKVEDDIKPWFNKFIGEEFG